MMSGSKRQTRRHSTRREYNRTRYSYIGGSSGVQLERCAESSKSKENSLEHPEHIATWFKDPKNKYDFFYGIGSILEAKEKAMTKSIESIKLALVKLGDEYTKNEDNYRKLVEDAQKTAPTEMKEELQESIREKLNVAYESKYSSLINKKQSYDLVKDSIVNRRWFIVDALQKNEGQDLIDLIQKAAEDIYTLYRGKKYTAIRKRLFEMIITISASPESFQASFSLNTSIVGPAGSGKTTMAKEIAKWYAKLGILTYDAFFEDPDKLSLSETARTDFIGEYTGQTGPKTLGVLIKSLEKTLFIDEAYSVAGCAFDKDDKLEADAYGEEFLATLLTFMNDHKGFNALIVAGYENLMKKCFMERNEGLPRRFPAQITLPFYTTDELFGIFLKNVVGKSLYPLDSRKTLLDKLIKENASSLAENVTSLKDCQDKNSKIDASIQNIKTQSPIDDEKRTAMEKQKADIEKQIAVMETQKGLMANELASIKTEIPNESVYRSRYLAVIKPSFMLIHYDTTHSFIETLRKYLILIQLRINLTSQGNDCDLKELMPANPTVGQRGGSSAEFLSALETPPSSPRPEEEKPAPNQEQKEKPAPKKQEKSEPEKPLLIKNWTENEKELAAGASAANLEQRRLQRAAMNQVFDPHTKVLPKFKPELPKLNKDERHQEPTGPTGPKGQLLLENNHALRGRQDMKLELAAAAAAASQPPGPVGKVSLESIYSYTIINQVLTNLLNDDMTSVRRHIFRRLFYKAVFNFEGSNMSYFPAQAGEMDNLADECSRSLSTKIPADRSKPSADICEEEKLINTYCAGRKIAVKLFINIDAKNSAEAESNIKTSETANKAALESQLEKATKFAEQIRLWHQIKALETSTTPKETKLSYGPDKYFIELISTNFSVTEMQKRISDFLKLGKLFPAGIPSLGELYANLHNKDNVKTYTEHVMDLYLKKANYEYLEDIKFMGEKEYPIHIKKEQLDSEMEVLKPFTALVKLEFDSERERKLKPEEQAKLNASTNSDPEAPDMGNMDLLDLRVDYDVLQQEINDKVKAAAKAVGEERTKLLAEIKRLSQRTTAEIKGIEKKSILKLSDSLKTAGSSKEQLKGLSDEVKETLFAAIRKRDQLIKELQDENLKAIPKSVTLQHPGVSTIVPFTNANSDDYKIKRSDVMYEDFGYTEFKVK